MPEKKLICIIGAGPSGLTCIRQLRDEGHDCICYEQTDTIGGLWNYREEVIDGVASVARSTIINTSKEYSAFSDFPPPDHFPNFMHHSLMLTFFEMYADANDLRKSIKFRHKVTNITFADDYDETGRWKVSISNLTSDPPVEEEHVFDGCMISSGHHTIPRIVKFPDQHLFKGKIMHTHEWKHATSYHNKRVCVVGAGNSAIDAIVDLSPVASQVYMSTRRGTWIRPRVSWNGWPSDTYFATRFFSFITSITPSSVKNTLLEAYANSRMDHAMYGLKPKHRFLKQHPVTNDALPNCILSGRVVVRPNIERFTEDGVIFEGQKSVTNVDVVILGTGYMKEIPFVDPNIIRPMNTNDETGGLYKLMFNPELKHAHTLALIGMAHPLGPLHPLSEVQSRWFAALMSGWARLPSKEQMQMSIEKEKAFYKQAYYDSEKHTFQTHYIPYLDEISQYADCRPNLRKYFTDFKLWYELFFGLYTPYQFRLEGRHQWPAARETILNTEKRIKAALMVREEGEEFIKNQVKVTQNNGNSCNGSSKVQ